ncbi:MAG TPA: polysaccharide lyase [Myxococcaceae bacterium]|nr:polysaccharide lyase [Myxococcaceae bacterium]
MHRSIKPLALMAAVALAGSAAASVLWRGDFETGDRSQWSQVEMISPDRLQVVDAPMRPGRHALRAEVRKGDDPINASGNRNELIRYDGASEGRELYYGWSTLWPADYPLTPTWQVFIQWHHPGNNGAPPVRFVLGCSAGDCGRPLPDTLFFIVDDKTMWQMAPVTRGAWHDFVLHIKWSADPGVGFVELWYDRQLVVPKSLVRTLYSSADTNYLKMGLYRDEATDPTQVLFQDGVIQATTYEEAAATARVDPLPSPSPDAGSPPAPGPTPAPDGGSPGGPGGSSAGGGLPGGPSEAAQVGCSQGATSAVSVPALLVAMALLIRRRSARR